jgi:hypothetical protein
MAIWALIVLATIASMAIAESMARTRGRPTKSLGVDRRNCWTAKSTCALCARQPINP